VLNAQASKLMLAPEHVATEKLLEKSGLNHDVLRMPWYSENYTGALGPAIEHGAIYGATGEGKLATASRADLAAAAVGALIRSPGGRTYELAGDHPWTMHEFADEVSRQSGKPVKYVNQSESDYKSTLEGAGLPPPVATLLASTSYLAGHGELYSDSKDLSELAGRPSTPIKDTIAAALKG
jgi:NAD(P)H dehydrogenase (quinone)